MSPKKKVKKKRVGSAEPAAPRKSTKGRRPSGEAPSKAPQKKKSGPRISADTYNKLQDAYFEVQTYAHAAKAAGVTKKTAKFYIEGPGRPEVGMTPIKQVWLDVQVEAQERKQMTLLRFQEEQAKELEEIVNTALGELRLVRAEVVRRLKRYKESGGKDIETGASFQSAIKSYERAVKLMERMLGAPDMTLKTTEGEDRYRNWSDQEIIDYMETGKVPEHAR
jgi:hypothetical protein